MNNNQMPYGFLPPQLPQYGNNSCQCQSELKRINERIENIERQIRRLERKVANLENNNMYVKPMPLSSNQANDDQYFNNYMI